MIAELIYQQTEPHRAACEVRVVSRLNEVKRGEYLDGVERHRGKDAAQALREAVWELVNQRGGDTQCQASDQR